MGILLEKESMVLRRHLNMMHTLWMNASYFCQSIRVDAFIIAEDPSVPQTQQPPRSLRGQRLPKPPRRQRMETVYTRLRNEFAHKRDGVDLEQTKAEMTHRLGDLRTLTRQAIELHP
jgi:hypothetical protein